MLKEINGFEKINRIDFYKVVALRVDTLSKQLFQYSRNKKLGQ